MGCVRVLSHRMSWATVRSLLAVGCCAAVACAQGPLLDYPALLERLVDVDWLMSPAPLGERCVQFSSYDRRAHQGPGTPGWYANDDRGQHLRVEERAGTKQFVMVDTKGPGCVARIWSANPSGTLHFDIDGARAWSVDFAALCSGKVDGVPEPLAGMRARGGNCHLPIPFAQSLVVSCTAGDCYYIFDVVQFAAGTRVPSFAPGMPGFDQVAPTARDLDAPGTGGGGLGGLLAHLDGPEVRCDTAAGSVGAVPAGHVVDRIEVTIDGADGAARAQVLSRVLLRVEVGGEQTVNVPLRDFFVVGSEAVAWRSHLLGLAADGTAWSRWPMPFPLAGSLRLVADGDLGPRRVALRATTRPARLAPDTLLFRASYQQKKAIPTRPFSDHLVLDAKGAGRFVGCSLLVRNPSRIWWGEGDEKFTVDGEAFPSWFGTGTEDYFGYAWCDPTPFQAPFHAQVECQGPGNFGFTHLHRTHVLDCVPFQQSFRFDLEVWHWVETIAIDYTTVAYWYGAPGATSGLPPVPPAAARALERLPSPPVFVAADAIEGEALRVLSCSGGQHVVQDLSVFEQTFSRDAHRWWRDGKPGDVLVLALPVPQAGRYRVTMARTRADDFAIVQWTLHGRPLGGPFDGYDARVGTTGPQIVGELDLPAGELELRAEIVGRNAKAKPSHMVGLDYVRLEKLP